mmetsp:Transcript_42874/g.130420  ORF Transcript_42874/g.130420 Transcript_42874/m.130420 type:complete len:169 (+) Transcript_42874:473-979(+)|eukprot:CAMPEP_0113553236 /NCGR_PEP_ID=MMETSP0015_2-20120614/15505_1 /TAXON_ID=2838 /ORGANISM="Odontella" /LENGTH=168 /DNA_ID=CAMNT_0000454291 /DNA_START=350 /DNA_END=856 /DNA_ORIENTATION=+ /assembly_acc=CAM_ASM_000160
MHWNYLLIGEVVASSCPSRLHASANKSGRRASLGKETSPVVCSPYSSRSARSGSTTCNTSASTALPTDSSGKGSSCAESSNGTMENGESLRLIKSYQMLPRFESICEGYSSGTKGASIRPRGNEEIHISQPDAEGWGYFVDTYCAEAPERPECRSFLKSEILALSTSV